VIELIRQAAHRGARVQLVVAGGHSDTWWARQNSARLYGQLMDAGVEIGEYEPTMLHHKFMVIDGAWATIGTTNFDNRSFALNEETNLCFRDPRLIAELEQVFAEDLAQSRKVNRYAWRRRGAWQRAQELVASLIQDQV
jgi:cardiolipin synthase